MNEKKNSPNWNIAATHFLTAGFVVPFLVRLVAMAIVGALFSSLYLSFIVVYIIQLAVLILSVWLGVIYSARYIYKKYVITNSSSIIGLSTAYTIILQAISLIIGISRGDGVNEGTAYGVIFSLVLILSFYFFSKKYISANITTTIA